MLTDDQTRVRLMPYEGVDGSDYINANYIDVSCKWFYVQTNDTALLLNCNIYCVDY